MRFNALDDRLIAQLKDRGAQRILDVGCGNGRFARRAALADLDVTGIDPLVIASDVKGSRLVKSRLQDYQSGGEFDSVVLQFVLHSISPLERVNLFRHLLTHHLPPGGTVVGMDYAKPGLAIAEQVAWAGICIDELLTVFVERNTMHFKNFRQLTWTKPYISKRFGVGYSSPTRCVSTTGLPSPMSFFLLTWHRGINPSWRLIPDIKTSF